MRPTRTALPTGRGKAPHGLPLGHSRCDAGSVPRSPQRFCHGLLALLSFVAAMMPAAQAQPLKTESVAWMLFVDDLHLQFSSTGRLRDLVRTIVTDWPEPADVIAMRTSGPSAPGTDFTSAKDLVWGVRRLIGNGLRANDILVAPGDREVRERAQQSLSVATSATALLGQADQMKRALIYISDGHPFDVTALPEGRALAQTATAVGARVFAIDGRILNQGAGPTVADPKLVDYLTAAKTSLRVIAEQSGGFAVLDRHEMPGALERIRNTMR